MAASATVKSATTTVESAATREAARSAGCVSAIAARTRRESVMRHGCMRERSRRMVSRSEVVGMMESTRKERRAIHHQR